MRHKNLIIFLYLLGLSVLGPESVNGGELYSGKTMFDDGIFRVFYRIFRYLGYRGVGQTGHRTRGSFLQEKMNNMSFPCDITNMRSKDVPKSVHKLKPGDIDVVAAMGDSLTAASGASSTNWVDLFMENRGLSWSIGGQWNWRNSTTLPNILRVYNPNLVGYSWGDAFPFHRESQFNVAEIGASSIDLPYMAKVLVNRIRSDRRVNFKRDWKMVTILMGGNDICSFVCSYNDPESLPNKYKIRLIKTLRYLRDNMPRTFVNIVPVPSVSNAVEMKDKPFHCQILHLGECSCFTGRLLNQTKEKNEKYKAIQLRMQYVEEEVVLYPEFRDLQEFAVVRQPFSLNLDLTSEKGETDFSLLSYDCFHMSQKGNAWAGTSLYNNLLEPTGNKTEKWASPQARFLCPTDEHPYIYTNDNGPYPVRYSNNVIRR